MHITLYFTVNFAVGLKMFLGHLQPYFIFDFKLNFGVKYSPTLLHIQLQNRVMTKVTPFIKYFYPTPFWS